ncbi:MAG: NAD-glutamate dehydrogenase [Parvibaculaceae bacterium]
MLKLVGRDAPRWADVVKAAGGPRKAEGILAAQLFAGAMPEDLRPYSNEDLAALARGAAKFIAQRKPGRAIVRLFEAKASRGGDVTVIEIANDDMPFLVDSALTLLTERACDIRLVLHPILSVRRTAAGTLEEISPERRDGDGFIRESLIHIHVGVIRDAAERESLRKEFLAVLDDVRTAVLDWRSMQARLREVVSDYQGNPPPVPVAELTEAMAFLQWLLDNHFTFLGVREYVFEGRSGEGNLKPVSGTGLGILRDPAMQVLRRGKAMVAMTPEIRAFLRQPAPLFITKSDALSTVHRRVPMDYIGIKTFDAQGDLKGELRVVGLFTSTAYTSSPSTTPLIRRKIEGVMAKSGFNAGSHSGKGLLNVLENFPRDELLQIETEELSTMAHGFLHLDERPRTRLFVRRDRFDRFVSAYLFIPRDRFNTDSRQRAGERLAKAYGGRVSSFAPSFGESPLVRVHFIITRDDTKPREPDLAKLEEEIGEILRTWDDRLAEAIVEAFDDPARYSRFYRGAFSLAYQDTFTPRAAIHDIGQIEGLKESDRVAVEFYRVQGDAPASARLKLYRYDAAIPLSGRLPILENMGFRAIEESTYRVERGVEGSLRPVFIHEVLLESADGAPIDIAADARRLEQAFDAVWSGAAENDGFNGLVLKAGLPWREAALLRACAKYLRQAGIPYSAEYIAATLVKHAEIAVKLVALFRDRFVIDGRTPKTKAARKPKVKALAAEIAEALNSVPSLDEDRIVRRLLNLMRSIERTNYYQPCQEGRPKPEISFKIDSRSLDELPAPRPFAEIFVYSPDFEGVHLRGGKIARGGLRWSDRPEDFRTEVLGLQKAQSVKNAVIVPVGAKGGFVPKRIPVGAPREVIQAGGVSAYKSFVSALLDITDNLDAKGRVLPPRDVARHDGDDPYLVVAADKGTATFSDIANGISEEHGFWLDDAFASGGSAGYDHKKMGITAKGGWEAVKRHFREMDRDIQTSPFTVMGVGDMSGDVFGNGMLLSREIRLLAAFDHRDIFLDPNPDAAKSFAERKRLFELPRSSWQDYDKKLISKGGGIFSRQLKAIPLSAEVKAMTGLETSTATPAELMTALLRLDVDLLWFGGIGTYVRASTETNQDAGDRANDGLRVTAAELRAKVVGEGANLGVTQKARVEYALKGGRINNDAVDNSAGVNSSDIEVNLKIALGAAEAAGKLKRSARNKLLASMTDEVAELVLRNNYLQTLCLSLGVARANDEIGYNARLIRSLESRGLIDRKLETLPDEKVLAERNAAGGGLTRPELAVLMAHAKIVLFDQILDSAVPDDPYLGRELVRYFPDKMTGKYAAEIAGHKLRREIIATMLANSMINRGGPSFVWRLKEETGQGIAEITAAYALARDSFGFVGLNESVDKLDSRIPTALQTEMYLELQSLMRRLTIWYLRNAPLRQGLEGLVAHYTKGIAELSASLSKVLPENARATLKERIETYVKAGVPDATARIFAGLRYLQRGPDVVLVASQTGRSIETVARVFFEAAHDLGVDRLIGQAVSMTAKDFYERLAINRSIDGIFQTHRGIVVKAVGGKSKDASWGRWVETHAGAVERVRRGLDELLSEKSFELSKLSVAASQLNELTAAV